MLQTSNFCVLAQIWLRSPQMCAHNSTSNSKDPRNWSSQGQYVYWGFIETIFSSHQGLFIAFSSTQPRKKKQKWTLSKHLLQARCYAKQLTCTGFFNSYNNPGRFTLFVIPSFTDLEIKIESKWLPAGYPELSQDRARTTSAQSPLTPIWPSEEEFEWNQEQRYRVLAVRSGPKHENADLPESKSSAWALCPVALGSITVTTEVREEAGTRTVCTTLSMNLCLPDFPHHSMVKVHSAACYLCLSTC